MNFLDLQNALKTKKESLYIIDGDDEFLIEKAIKQIMNVCGNEFPELNQNIFDNENFEIDKVIESLNQMPFISDRRFVLLKKIEKLNSDDKEKLKSYLENVNDSCTLVIVKTDSFSFIKNGTVVDCRKLNPKILFKYIASSLNDRGKKITEDACKLLMEYCSYDMTRISQELKKLELYDLDGNIINKELINEVVTPDEEYAVFELTEALGKKQGDKAVKILNTFLEKKEPIQNILSLIIGNFRRMIFCGLSDYSDEDLSEMFKVKPYAITKSRESAANFSKPQLNKILNLLYEIDFMIKSGEMQGENAIYFLVFNILNV